MLQKILQLFEGHFNKKAQLSPAKFAEENIRIPKGVSSIPGRFKWDYFPFFMEILEHLSPMSPTREICVMGASQIGKTQNVILPALLYIMSECPGPTMMLSGDEALLKTFIKKRLDPAIRDAKLEDLLAPTVKKIKNSASGDTDSLKEFRGGSIMLKGMQNLSNNMRQDSIQYMFCDDFDMALTSKDGTPEQLIKSRIEGFLPISKIYWMSKPNSEELSHTFQIYLRGDQRKYHIICPCCKKYIHLEFAPVDEEGSHLKVDGKRTGVVFDVKEGKVIRESIRYRCQKCAGEFTEMDKFKIVRSGKGKHIATATAQQEGLVSYQINRLLAPPQHSGWFDICQKFQAAYPRGGHPNQEALKSFFADVLGIPWKTSTKPISSKTLSKNSRLYEPGIVPTALSVKDGNGDIVIVTLASDLNGKLDDGRLDYSIVGWARNGQQYYINAGSIGTFKAAHKYRVEDFEKEKDREKWSYRHDSKNCIWIEFMRIIESTLKADDGGADYPIAIALVDTGNVYGYEETETGGVDQTVYSFIERARFQTTVPIYGVKGEGVESSLIRDRKTFKLSPRVSNLYLLNTIELKNRLAYSLMLRWDGSEDQDPLHINFPKTDGHQFTQKGFYDHFSAEEKGIDVKRNTEVWKKRSGKENHHFDCACYNLAAKDILVKIMCDDLKIEPTWTSFVDKFC